MKSNALTVRLGVNIFNFVKRSMDAERAVMRKDAHQSEKKLQYIDFKTR